jgi:hypothetical protein
LTIKLLCRAPKLTGQVNFMQRFIIEQSGSEFYTHDSGLPLVGQAPKRFTTLVSSFAKAVPTQDIISHGE